jgi:hypothetical protein
MRDELPEAQRIPYYLYIDEFQTYAAHSEHSLINLFNGARKYKLAVTIAHQTTSDIPAKLLSTIVGNVGTVITLQLAADDAPYFARELQIRKDDKDAYAPEALQNLTVGNGYVRTPQNPHGIPISIPSTPVVSLPHPIPADELKTRSKKNFGLMPQTKLTEHDSEGTPFLTRDSAPPRTATVPVPPPETHAEETDTLSAVAPVGTDEPVAEASAIGEAPVAEAPVQPTRKRPAPTRKPVVRKTIKKKSLIPEESIEIE